MTRAELMSEGIIKKPPSEREGDREVVEGACVTLKSVLNSIMYALSFRLCLRQIHLPLGGRLGALGALAPFLVGGRHRLALSVSLRLPPLPEGEAF